MSRKTYPIRTIRHSWNIPITCTHRCNNNCKKTLVPIDDGLNVFVVEDNPNFRDGKCDRFGKIENTAVKMSEYSRENPVGVNGDINDTDDVVIPNTIFNMKVDYPLTNSVDVEIRAPSKKGITRLEILFIVSNIYRNIYEEEERTAVPETFSIKKECEACKKVSLSDALEELKSRRKNDIECCICYADESDDECEVCELKCGHIYHHDCINKWVKSDGDSCPMCRTLIRRCEECNGKGFIYYDYEGVVIPVNLRGRNSNRNRTNGRYGIYMHDYEDLYIEEMVYNRLERRLTIKVNWRLNLSSIEV